MEELLLAGGGFAEKLDIVHHQHVHIAHFGAQLGGAALAGDGLDELVGEAFGGGEHDAGHGVLLDDEVAHGVHEVGFAQAHVAIDEQGVIDLAGLFGHGQGCGVGEVIGRADHEVIEGILRVEHGFADQLFLFFELGFVQDAEGIAHAEGCAHGGFHAGMVALDHGKLDVGVVDGDHHFGFGDGVELHGADPHIEAGGREGAAEGFDDLIPERFLFGRIVHW